MTCGWLDNLWIWLCLCKDKLVDMLLGCHAFANRFWLSARLAVCAPFFSALMTGRFGFTYSRLYILKLGSPLDSRLILDIVLGCYFVSFKKPPHMDCVFAHCVSWCICLSPFHRAIAFSHTMHRLANFLRKDFILVYSKLPCGNEIVICCVDFPIMF